jgi:hypothetical protein
MQSQGENQLVPKKSFAENVQKWVYLDTQLRTVNEKLKTMKEMKQQLGKEICEYMTKNQLQDKKIGITDGNLRIYEKKEYSPLTFGYLEKTLLEIIPDKGKVDYIIQYIKEKREIKISTDIKRQND